MFLGFEAGRLNTTGTPNTFLGYRAGYSNTTGSQNTFLGYETGGLAPTLTNASAIGYNAKVGASDAMVLGATGVEQVNVGIGTTTPDALLNIEGSKTNGYSEFFRLRNLEPNGFSNLFLESDVAGDGLSLGCTNSGLVGFPGYGQPGDSYVYVDIGLVARDLNIINSSTGGKINLQVDPNGMNGAPTMTLDTTRVGINTSTPTQALHVIGNILASGTVTPSDVRFKENVKNLNHSLEKIQNLRGVSYNHKAKFIKSHGLKEGNQIGFIAQELEKYFQNL